MGEVGRNRLKVKAHSFGKPETIMRYLSLLQKDFIRVPLLEVKRNQLINYIVKINIQFKLSS